MNKFKWSALFSFSLGCMMLFLHFFAQSTSESPETISTKINLAIRQTIHNLHKIAEDSTSLIFPVEQVSENTHRIEIEKCINYDTLPTVLDAALKDFNIDQKYMVSIEDCEEEKILLGYNLLAFEKNEVACRGREISNDCSVLKVTFDEVKKGSMLYLPVAFLSFIIGGIGLFVSVRTFEKQKNEVQSTKTEPASIQIGNSFFQTQNLTIQVNGKAKRLTFRESKLLEYLAMRPNQVLKREDIQDHVWNDEGIIVGRSLDVFISRLRKILKEDDTLAIKNIHGVGYRLEIR
jgi:hypothetical protein